MSNTESSSRNLSDVSKSINRYIYEARACARHSPDVLGLAAMTTTLSCVVAVGEALIGRTRPSDKDCIEAFCDKITDYSWLLLRNGTATQHITKNVLPRLRNALIHALSLPDDVCLVPSKAEYTTELMQSFSHAVIPLGFVEAIANTINTLLTQGVSPVFDTQSAKKQRSPVEIPDGTSASTPRKN